MRLKSGRKKKRSAGKSSSGKKKTVDVPITDDSGDIRQGTIAKFMRKRTQLVGFETGLNKHNQFSIEFMQNAIDGIWDVYSQTMTTGLSPETWQTQGIKVIERVVASPGGRLFWAMFSGTYPNDFRAEVDRILDTQSTDTWRPPQKNVTPDPASHS